MKKQIVIAMLVLLALCWYVTAESFLGNDAKYDVEMKKAAALEEKEIYITAISYYENAMKYKPGNYEAMYGIAQDYLKLEELDNYESQLKSMLDRFGPNKTVLSELYQYYMDNEEVSAAAELAYEMKDKYPDNEFVSQIYEERKGDYSEVFATFSSLSSYMEGYTIFESIGKKGLVDAEGDIAIQALYDEISYPSGENKYIAVKSGGKAYYINEDGYKIAEPDGGYTYLSSESSGCILAQRNNKYGYLNAEYNELTEFQWDDATKIFDGIGAVKKGEKWALINSEFKTITDYIYDDIIQNEWRVCSYNGVVWVGKNGQYELVDATGKVLTTEKYDMVKPFVSEEPCAVMKEEKWGFVNVDGTVYIEPQYEGADSFNLGYAPVMKQQQWGLIDSANTLTMEYTFDEMKPLSNKGVIPVKREDIWTVVQMKIFE